MIAVSAGQRSMAWDKSKGWQAGVDNMIAFWKNEADCLLRDKPDIIVIPEASDRYHGLPMDERLEYYNVRGEQVKDFWCKIARENNTYVAYSACRHMPDGTWRNSTQIIDRTGNVCGIYNKNHLVIEETTKGGILCGKDAPIINTDFGRVGCAICFDLNFEPIRKKYEATQPDMILFSSMYHGGLMQPYWAYACRSYFVGAICGDECTVLNPVGQVVSRTTNYFHRLSHEVNLDYKVVHLDHNWGKLDAMKAKYGRWATVTDPGQVGAVMITSEMDDVTADDLIKEFDFELLDHYFDRSLKHWRENLEP